jgi:hypothetical protein
LYDITTYWNYEPWWNSIIMGARFNYRPR